jgi:hypothetical protein
LAGLGRKIFNSGDILLASEVQGYLQDQAVMVFDDSATRATAIGTANFSEGMVTYTKDDDAIQVYDGSNFVGVGSDSGLIHIKTVSDTGVSAVNIGSDADPLFTSDYENYKIILTCESSTQITARLRENVTDASGSNYERQSVGNVNTTVSATSASNDTFFNLISNYAGASASFGIIEILRPQLAVATFAQITAFHSNTIQNFFRSFKHTLTTQYNGISFISASGNFTNIKIKVYGYKD